MPKTKPGIFKILHFSTQEQISRTSNALARRALQKSALTMRCIHAEFGAPIARGLIVKMSRFVKGIKNFETNIVMNNSSGRAF